MNKKEIIEKLERRKRDLNFMINSDAKSKEKQYAWKYARNELDIVIEMLED